MEHVDNIFEDNISMDELLGETFDPESGEIVNGDVVSVDSDFVYVNVGGKTEGKVQAREFDTPPAVGSKIEVYVKNRKTNDGMYQLSHTMARRIGRWADFSAWLPNGENNVTGKIISIKQNGAVVDFGLYEGFVPKNHAADIRFKDAVASKEEYIFKIIKVDEKKKSVILSRKEYLDELREVAWNKIISENNEGDSIQGTVVRMVEFGAFVDLGGFEALLHNNDLTWRKVFTRKEYVKKGMTADFKILAINKEEHKISLGLKQLKEDPWSTISSKYPVDSVNDGVVVALTNYGVFVELEEGVEGLVAADEMQWSKKAPNPRAVFKKEDNVSVKVLAINEEERTLSLSIKQTIPNPWVSLVGRYPVGTVCKGVIKNIVEFGLFVALEDNVDAFVHVSDLSWDDNAKKEIEAYSVGQEVEYKIMSINPDEMKVSASIKHLEKSPWDVIKEKFPPRTRLKGKITSVKSFGLFVQIDENIEGLVHISEVSKRKIENLEEMYEAGTEIDVVVLDVDTKKKKISLSIKSLEVQKEKEEIKMILDAQSSSTASIGDLLKLKEEDQDK